MKAKTQMPSAKFTVAMIASVALLGSLHGRFQRYLMWL
jgi:hypothetical protein